MKRKLIKKNKKRKGFTLIELLAVILILGIIALIAIPTVSSVVEQSRKGAFENTVRNIIKAVEQECLTSKLSDTDYPETIIITNGESSYNIDIKGKLPNEAFIYVETNKCEVAIKAHDGNNMILKEFNEEKIKLNDFKEEEYVLYTTSEVDENGNKIYRDKVLNGADPEISSGMIPVIISDDGTLTKADLSSEWYNYANKKWANIVLVNDEVRESYENAPVGANIELSDVLAYYVWVPRFKYELYANISDIKIISNIDASTYIDKSHEIKISFENNRTPKSNGNTVGSMLTHPAFTFGDEELNGIWVGKFETTGTVAAPTILPGEASIKNQTVSVFFRTSQKINYGTNKESSMLKNSEWGAIAYLTNSKYGRCNNGVCEEVERNNNNSLTGYAAVNRATIGLSGSSIEANEFGTKTSVTQPYNTVVGYKASTTGNITGIYDLSGGAWEYVMAVLEDSLGSGIPMSGRHNVWNSGFNGKFGHASAASTDSSGSLANGDPNIKELTTGVNFPDKKYYDLYEYGTSNGDARAFKRTKLGDATGETLEFSGWIDPDTSKRYHGGFYADQAAFVYNGNPWLLRGGTNKSGINAGIFAFATQTGQGGGTYTFRTIIR